MQNTAVAAPTVNDWYFYELDGPSACAWPRGSNVYELNPPEPEEPELPEFIQLYLEVTPEMQRFADDEMQMAHEAVRDPGDDPREAWRDACCHFAAAELLSTGGLRVDEDGQNWEPISPARELLEVFVQAHADNWAVRPGDFGFARGDARCMLFQEKSQLLLSEQRAKAKRESKKLAEEAKDKLPEIFRRINAKMRAVSKTTTELELDKIIRNLCKAGLTHDVMAEAYLVEQIAKLTSLGMVQTRKMVQKIVAEMKKAEAPSREVGGNIVNQDDHKSQVAYARAKLEDTHKQDPTLFRYGTENARVQHVPEEGTTSVAILNKDGLRAAINECANYCRINEKGETRGVSAPPDVVSDLSQEQLPIPYLRQVSNYPQFDEAGNLLASDGYHEAGYLYMHLPTDLDMAGVSTHPASDELREAIRLLVEEWLADFPFDGYNRRQILVACKIKPPRPPEAVKPVPPSLLSFLAFVLQPLVRSIIGKSPMPALLVSKPEAGTGATLLVDTAQSIVHGTTSTRTIPKDEDERRKEVFAALRGGDPFIFLDNVTGSVDSPVLAALLTSVVFTGRILGKSEEASIPNTASVVITGNNPRFTRELQRRLSLCRLDACVSEPENRVPDEGWRHEHIDEWVSENRGQLLWALCTLVAHWQAEGRPKPAGTPIGSYRSWYNVCGGILSAAGLDGFQSNRDQIEQVAGADDDDPMRELVTQWYEEAMKCGALGMNGQLVKDVGDKIGLAAFCDARDIELPVAKHVVDGERNYKPSALGQYLGSQAERVFNVDDGVSVRIESGKKGKHGKPWSLIVV